MATLAVAMSFGGSAYAASQLTGLDIRNGSIKSIDIRDASLTGRDIRNASVTRADLAPSAVVPGPQGPQGAPGQAGPAGPAGPAGSVDTSKFYDKATSDARFALSGNTEITSHPHGWRLLNPGGFGAATQTPRYDTMEFSRASNGYAGLGHSVTLPAGINGRYQRVSALRYCYSVPASGYFTVWATVKSFANGTGQTVPGGTVSNLNQHTGQACSVLRFPAPVLLARGYALTLGAETNWGAAGAFQFGPVTVVLSPSTNPVAPL